MDLFVYFVFRALECLERNWWICFNLRLLCRGFTVSAAATALLCQSQYEASRRRRQWRAVQFIGVGRIGAIQSTATASTTCTVAGVRFNYHHDAAAALPAQEFRHSTTTAVPIRPATAAALRSTAQQHPQLWRPIPGRLWCSAAKNQ